MGPLFNLPHLINFFSPLKALCKASPWSEAAWGTGGQNIGCDDLHGQGHQPTVSLLGTNPASHRQAVGTSAPRPPSCRGLHFCQADHVPTVSYLLIWAAPNSLPLAHLQTIFYGCLMGSVSPLTVHINVV